MDDGDRQGDDILNNSQVDLEKIRESRLQRTREAMMEFDRDIANSVIPENRSEDNSSVVEKAAVCVQKHFRGYLGRKQYRNKLLEQYEKDEEERQKRQKQQTEEAEILVEMARLQLEAEEDDTIHRNKQRMLNVYATRIQRAWRRYAAKQSTNHDHQGDSFEEQLYQATGLNVTDVITSNATNTTTNQSEPEPHTNSSILHSNDNDIQASVQETKETSVEDTKEASPTIETIQHINEGSPVVETTGENNLTVEGINQNSPANVDTIEEIHQEEDTAGNETAIMQKGDRKVRFDLQNTEEKEDSTVTDSSIQSDAINNNTTLPSAEDSVEMNSNSDFVSVSEEITLTVPVEKIKLLGYTQLRELKCRLETKLGSLSDQLITELQNRDRLLAHKDFLLEKIQNLSKLVQNQHKLKQKERRRIKSSGH